MALEISLGEFVSIGIGAVVAVVLIISLKIQHNDVSLRQRPWIAGYAVADKDSVELKNLTIVLHLINRGPVPAFNVIPKGYCLANEPKGEKEDFTTQPGFNIIDLGPSEDYHIAMPVPKGTIDNTTNNGIVYYGLFIEYEDLNKTKRHYTVRGRFKNNFNLTTHLKID